jgi:hypothetical protein
MCLEYFLIFKYRNFDFRNKFFIVRILEKLISIILFPETNRQWLERRFLANDPIRIVFDYLTVEGYPTEEFKVLSSWPRRDVSYNTFEKPNNLISLLARILFSAIFELGATSIFKKVISHFTV